MTRLLLWLAALLGRCLPRRSDQLGCLTNTELDALLGPTATGVHVSPKPYDRYATGRIPVGSRVRLEQGYSGHVGWIGKVIAYTDGHEFPYLVHWDNGIPERCSVYELEVLSVPDDHSLPTLGEELDSALGEGR